MEQANDIKINANETEDLNCNYWWLNANPRIWKYADIAVGETQEYSYYTEKTGRKRPHLKDTKVGDMIIGYQSGNVKKIVSLCKVLDTNNEGIIIEKVEDFSNPITYKTLQSYPELQNVEPLKGQGRAQSMYPLTKSEYDFILQLVHGEMPEDAQQQKERFKDWMREQTTTYSSGTINQYTSQMEEGFTEFKPDKTPYKNYSDIFQIQQVQELNEYKDHLRQAPGYNEFKEKKGNDACWAGLTLYTKFLKGQFDGPKYYTGYESKYSRNWIVFGAPGTGKSYLINQEKDNFIGEDNEDDYERVTFHPDYSYANFVGTYKPVPCKDNNENDSITYKYVPGPFMRVLVKALKNAMTDNPKPFLLIIEEINRADMAAVFGDVFQLLDRGDDNVSEYPIEASEDMREYLAGELQISPEACSKICIPDNMFIWATMNSADQGVFPMDTAFKRRWDFTYRGIDESEDDLIGKYVELGEGADKQRIEWNNLRKAINKFLSDNGINEDKQLGPYFIARKIVVPEDGDVIKSEDFISAFKDKVLMYLFEDAARQRRSELFSGPSSRYSEICEDFKKKGIKIFCQEIVNEYENMPVKRSDAGD